MKTRQIQAIELIAFLKSHTYDRDSSAFLFGKSIKANVKSFENGQIVLSYDGKVFEAKTLYHFFPNEKITLKILSKNELEVESRSFALEKEELKSILTNSPREFLEKTIHESEPKTIFQILKTFFPEIDWSENTNYVHWDGDEFSGEGYYNAGKQKKFLLKLDHKVFGKMDFLISWNDEACSEITIESRIEKEDTYEKFLFRRNLFFSIFEDSDILLKNASFVWNREGFVSKGWEA
ncbi:MAG: hypothetical protein SFU98_11575 [Leptospiraceae bacterium]|nr:hypothetical protein [Leptospiraceae bacterium]